MNAKHQSGFSLIESLLIIVILGIIVGLLAILPNAINLINKSKHISLAKEIAAKQLEDKRTIKYVNMDSGNKPINDSRLSLLPKGAGVITIENCDSQVCTNEEHTKQVTIQISWQDNSKAQTVILKTLISEGGLNQ